MSDIKEPHNEMTEQRMQSVIEQLWLTYYNDTLYAKGAITEEQRNKMRLRIRNRAATCQRWIIRSAGI